MLPSDGILCFGGCIRGPELRAPAVVGRIRRRPSVRLMLLSIADDREEEQQAEDR
jgi:hypothetical protein